MVLAAGGWRYSVAVTDEGALFAWGHGFHGQLGLGDRNDRLTPTRVGSDEAFDGSRVLLAICNQMHTLTLTEAGTLWSCGGGNYGRLGHGDQDDRLTPTQVDPQHFDSKKIAAAAIGLEMCLALTEDGRLYSWGSGFLFYEQDEHIGESDEVSEEDLVPTPVDQQHLQGARVGRYHSLPPLHVLAFAMSLHPRLGEGCHEALQDENLIKMVAQRCVLWPEGVRQRQAAVLLMGGMIRK